MSTPIAIHKRQYETEAFYEDERTMRVRGRLTDTKPQGLALADGDPLVIHDMTLDLIIDVSNFEITEVLPAMDVHPYDACVGILESYKQLVGVSIARGYSRKVRELFGGPNGCSHIGALLIALGPVAIQASWSFTNLHDDPLDRAAPEPAPEFLELLYGNENSCHIWETEGSQMTMLRNGERPLRPTWESERIVELQARNAQAD